MSSTTYPFDPTGLATSNLITNEPHILTEIATSASEVSYNEFHLLIPDYSPFFNDGFILTHVTGGVIVPLVRGTDYQLCLPYLDASRSTLKDIFGGISILSQFSSGLLKITYQTVGGDWIADKERALLAAFNQPWFNIRRTTWDVLTDKSSRFPVISHDNTTDFIDGHSSLVDAINLASISVASTARQSLAIVDHFIDINNPHHVTAAQIGLDKLVDYPPATLVEARTFKKVDKYATMAAVMEFLNAFKKQVAISGPSVITVGTPATFTIINYRPYMTYKLEVTGGTATIVGNTITLTPSSPSTMISFSINGTKVPVYSRPVNSPATGSVTISGNRTVGMTLTATNTIADTDGLGPFHYQWYSGTTPVGSDSDKYVSVTSDITSYITCVVSYQDKMENNESVTSNRFGPIRKVDSLPTGSVIINGVTTVFETLTVDTSSIADTNTLGALHYEWFADGVAIGTDSPSYTLQHDDRKKKVTCKVSYLDGDEYTDSIISAPTPLIRDYDHLPLGDLTVPTVAIVDTTLVATNTITDENGLGTFHYQWYSGGTAVGTNNPTYTPVIGDVGNTITCIITYTDSDNYVDTVTSNVSDPVKNKNFTPTGTATVDGDAAVDNTLTINSSIADQNGLGTFHYQWYSGADKVGTDSNSYTIAATDLGKKITAVITYTDGDGYDTTYSVTTGSGTTAVIPPNASPQGNVVIQGNRWIYTTLTADVSNITDADGMGPITSYDWFMWLTDWTTNQHYGYVSKLLQSGTSNTYTIPVVGTGAQAMEGQWIGVRVRYTDGKGVVNTAYSDSGIDCTESNKIQYVVTMTGKLYVTGAGYVGSDVNAMSTIDTTDPLINQYNGKSSNGHLNVAYWFKWTSGAVLQSGSSAKYRVQPSDEGQTIICQAAYLDQYRILQLIDGDKMIGPIGPVPPNNPPTGSLNIIGSANVGYNISISNAGSIDDADGLGTFHYQWYAGTTKVGTDSNSYTPQSSDIGKMITCVISYTDGRGTLETVTSNAIGPIV